MEIFDLSKIRLVDDMKSNRVMIKEIIEVNKQEDAFFLLDVGDVVRKVKRWQEKMPRVIPYFAMKCHPDPTVVRVIAALDGRFDCASQQEMQMIIENGVSPDSIIYANTMKAPSHLRYAAEIGVEKMTVDTVEEILIIKRMYPEAKLIIRIAIDGSAYACGMNFSGKFGCKPGEETIELMSFIKSQGMCLYGFSFHLGSPCYDTEAFGRGTEICYELIKISESMGFTECKLIDIGGGMSGIEEESLDKIAQSVNAVIDKMDPSIEVIAEPGRYYVDTAFTLAVYVQGKKLMKEGDTIKRCYYINEGKYGSFLQEPDLIHKTVTSLYKPSDEKHLSVIWGQTCSPFDIVIDNCKIQDFSIGDWMIWKNMGAYTVSYSTLFNGYPLSRVFPIIRRSALKEFLTEMKKIGRN